MESILEYHLRSRTPDEPAIAPYLLVQNLGNPWQRTEPKRQDALDLGQCRGWYPKETWRLLVIKSGDRPALVSMACSAVPHLAEVFGAKLEISRPFMGLKTPAI